MCLTRLHDEESDVDELDGTTFRRGRKLKCELGVSGAVDDGEVAP
jgi:hypothetical protein